MLIRTRDIEIPTKEPFKFDILSRSEIEPILTNLVKSGQGQFCLAINSPWGTGKTTFLKMWQTVLQQQDSICLYLNAWEVDYSTDPLIPIISKLSQEISLQRNSDFQSKVDKLKKIGGSIARKSIPAIIKHITLGVIDASEISETILSTIASNAAEDRIKAYEDSLLELSTFRDVLTSLSTEVSLQDNKLVIVVDELDRCRPLFAIQLLERIKHLFNVDGVVFVLGMHLEELSHSIKAVYGRDFDATGYLRRFIDFEYRLPIADSEVFCDHLMTTFEVFDGRRQNTMILKQDLVSLISGFFKIAQFSLRQQQQFIARLGVVSRTIPQNAKVYEVPLAILLFLKFEFPSKFELLKTSKITYEDALTTLENKPGYSELDQHLRDIVEAYLLIGHSESGRTSNRLKMHQKRSKNQTDSKSRVLNIYNGIEGDNARMYKIFGGSIDIIELTSNFVSS